MRVVQVTAVATASLAISLTFVWLYCRRKYGPLKGGTS